jgi:two-component system, NarL family, response regulator DegU
MGTDKIKVYIYSRQNFFRQGLITSLSSIEDLEIMGDGEFDIEALSGLEEALPDVAIVDIDTPGDEGMAKTRKLKQHLPNIGIIALTYSYNDMRIFEALKSQASACMSKEINADQLVEAVRRVARGEHPINEALITHPILADQVLRQFQALSRQNETREVVSPLTRRETEILDYIAQGMLNKQIATQCGISEQTIKNHVTSILRKLNANARTEAVVFALRQGLITIS